MEGVVTSWESIASVSMINGNTQHLTMIATSEPTSHKSDLYSVIPDAKNKRLRVADWLSSYQAHQGDRMPNTPNLNTSYSSTTSTYKPSPFSGCVSLRHTFRRSNMQVYSNLVASKKK